MLNEVEDVEALHGPIREESVHCLLLIVEQLNMIKNGDWRMYFHANFFLVNDPDVMYTFHFYSPFEYTHQLLAWTTLKDKDGGNKDGYDDAQRNQE